MGQKFHINAQGVPAPCRATKGNCPFGGSDGNQNHFDTMEEAQEFADRQNAKEFGILGKPEMELKSHRKDVPLDDLDHNFLKNKDVYIRTKDGDEYSGIVSGSNDDTIELSEVEDERVELNVADIDTLRAMELGYRDRGYKDYLKEHNIPKAEYRFRKEDLDNYEGNYVRVGYEGGSIEGKVIDVEFRSRDDSSITVLADDGEVKTIENFTMDSLEERGSTEQEYEYNKKVDEVFYDTAKYLDKILDSGNGVPDYWEFSDEIYAAESLARDYFEARIEAKREGASFDKQNDKYEVDVEKERYYSVVDDGPVHFKEVWTQSSEEIYSEALMKAEKVESYYQDLLVNADEAVYMVEQVDWTQYGKSQVEGEIEALEFMDAHDLVVNPKEILRVSQFRHHSR